MKSLTPAKLVMLVFVAMAMMIVFYVAKTMLAKEPPPRRIGTRMIPMAVGDIEPGTMITQQHLGTGPWPANDLKDDALLSAGGIVGRVVRNRIEGATVIRGRDLYQFNEQPPLTVSENHRAVAVSVKNGASILEGLVKPGDFVDVIYTPKRMESDDRYKMIGGLTVTLFKGVRMLALNNGFVQGPIEATQNTVILEVKKADAAMLQLAADTGEVTLQYTDDRSGTATVTMADPNRPTLEELLQLPDLPEPPPPPPLPEPPPAPPEPNVHQTQVYRGSGMNAMTFVNGQPSRGYNGPGAGALGGLGNSGADPGPLNGYTHQGNSYRQIDQRTGRQNNINSGGTFRPLGTPGAGAGATGTGGGYGTSGGAPIAPGTGPATSIWSPGANGSPLVSGVPVDMTPR